jgi:AcrR family transcriptional regulator
MPRQTRAEATLDAIFEATIQVLLAEGERRLTTTRVAKRAGVSVGTMYQYFPHKQALLYAVLQWHLAHIAGAVEAACQAVEGVRQPRWRTVSSTLFSTQRPSCAYRKSNPGILMMETAQDRAADNVPGPLGGAWYRCILVQGQMSARGVVVIFVQHQHVAQMAFAEYHDMIDAFPAD